MANINKAMKQHAQCLIHVLQGVESQHHRGVLDKLSRKANYIMAPLLR